MSLALRISTVLIATVVALACAGAATARTTVIKGHFEYDLDDPSVGTVHFVCKETRVERSALTRETIHCKTTDTSHSSAVIYSPTNLFGGLYPWFSDFTGQESVDFHLVGTPSGNLDGWAIY
jgi:hypothetical protein